MTEVGRDPTEARATTNGAGSQPRRSAMRCMVFGHDYTFGTEGPTMRWQCSRGCDAGGSKTYPSAQHAARYATAFNRRDTEDLGRRAPLIGLLPLRLWRRMRGGR